MKWYYWLIAGVSLLVGVRSCVPDGSELPCLRLREAITHVGRESETMTNLQSEGTELWVVGEVVNVWETHKDEYTYRRHVLISDRGRTLEFASGSIGRGGAERLDKGESISVKASASMRNGSPVFKFNYGIDHEHPLCAR
jgi:hypothetical protein